MNRSIRHTFLTATVACGLWLAPATAQTTATTDPVGAMTFLVPKDSDAFIGIPFVQPSSYDGGVLSLEGSVVTVEGNSSLAVLSAASKFVLFKSGSLKGKWFTVTGFTDNTFTCAENLQELGAAEGDLISIHDFWTLGDFFDGGSGFPVSSNLLSPEGSLSFKNLTTAGINRPISAEYIFYDGSVGGDAGWYDNNNLGSGLKNDISISPETYMIIRNNSDSDVQIKVSGTVLANSFGMVVGTNPVGEQDNYLVNPYPVGLSLDASGLEGTAVNPSSDILSPTDRLFLYEPVGNGFNRPISSEYFYYDGSMGGSAGWYDANSLGSGTQGNIEIPAGAGFIVRKAASATASNQWISAPPY